MMAKAMIDLTALERHDTYTQYHVSVGLKLVFAMFINTALIPFAVNYYNEDWIISDGLVRDIFFNVISIWFVGPLINLFSPSYFYLLFKRCREEKKRDKWALTQRQLNMLYEGTPIEIAQKLSSSMLLLMVSCYYATLVPIVPVIWFFGGVHHYWINKYMLLRRHKIPEQMGKDLEVVFRRLIPFVIFLTAIGQYLFSNSSLGLCNVNNWQAGINFLSLSSGLNWYLLIPIGLSLIYFLYPLPSLTNCVEKQNVNRSNKDTYEQHKKDFIFDYNKANPVKFKRSIIYNQEEAKNENNSEENKLNWLSNSLKHFQSQIRFEKLFRYGSKINIQDRAKDHLNLNIIFKNQMKRISQIKTLNGIANYQSKAVDIKNIIDQNILDSIKNSSVKGIIYFKS